MFQMFVTLVLILIFFLFSQVNESTGKATRLLILGILEGVSSSNTKIEERHGQRCMSKLHRYFQKLELLRVSLKMSVSLC